MRRFVRSGSVVALVACLTGGLLAATRAQEATPAASPGASPIASPVASPSAEIDGTFDVGGRSLYLRCTGAGSPTVIFDAGQGGGGLDMDPLRRTFAETNRACFYDRAGQGLSDPAPTSPRTAGDVVADLHALLTVAEVPGPYLLVGQSAAGVFVQLYARTYVEDVVGAVAMNPVPALPGFEAELQLMTDAEREGAEAYYRGEGGSLEPIDWYASFAQMGAAPPPPDIPFALVISTITQCESPNDLCSRTYTVYEEGMQAMAAAWPQGRYTQLEGGHNLYREGAYEEVIDIIRGVLTAVA